VSIQQDRPVIDIISQAAAPTLQLSLTAFVVAMLLGLALAVGASSTRLPWLRQFLQSIPPLTLALPGFWLGLMLLEIFSFTLHWFPSFGDKGLPTLVLPVITLAIPVSAGVGQVLTKSFLGTWGQSFVQVARTKGFGRVRLLHSHVLRNSIMPALTMAGMVFGSLLVGTVVTETVFSRPGLGRVLQEAVQQQDIPIVQLMVVLAAVVFVIVNLVVDALYPIIDPRIRRRALRVA
jgi:ABC-type dipeptide/oligopeptide/nickel transport systems, permease components